MFASLAEYWFRADAETAAHTDAAPPRKRRAAPVLMGDLFVARCGEPEFLIRWRADADRAEDPAEH